MKTSHKSDELKNLKKSCKYYSKSIFNITPTVYSIFLKGSGYKYHSHNYVKIREEVFFIFGNVTKRADCDPLTYNKELSWNTVISYIL